MDARPRQDTPFMKLLAEYDKVLTKLQLLRHYVAMREGVQRVYDLEAQGAREAGEDM